MLKSSHSNPRYLIVGLGNPKEKYENTRHNIGFKAINEVATGFNFPDSNFQSSFNAEISKGTIKDKDVFLVKPLTFMNLSGKSVAKIARFYKIKPAKIIVIHDDIDISLGKIKIVKNRGAGGHRGIESIIRELGSKNFTRIRIGISPEKKPLNAEIFVLQKFKEEEKASVNKTLQKTVKIVDMIMEEGLEKTASLFNE